MFVFVVVNAERLHLSEQVIQKLIDGTVRRSINNLMMAASLIAILALTYFYNIKSLTQHYTNIYCRYIGITDYDLKCLTCFS